MSKRSLAQNVFRVSKFGQYPVAAGETVKVHKSGIFWLLGEEETSTAGYTDQSHRPGLIEYERILLELHRIDAFGTDLYKIGAGMFF